MSNSVDMGDLKFHPFSELKNLVGKSMLYGTGSIILKLINFILIPIYTRFIAPKEYGILAITSSVLAVLVILFSLEMRGAINYFYSHFNQPENRNRNISTLWLAMIIFALFMAILFDTFGDNAFSTLFKSIPYVPYFRIVIWTAFFIVLGQVPQVLFQVKETPIPFVVLLLISAILNIGISVYLIVFIRLGALGFLLGAFLSALLMAIPYLFITIRLIRPTFRWTQLGPILAYSLPLVIHSLSAWLLEYSDRVIMERIIPLSQIGIYSLGYQFGMIVNLYSAAVNAAWVPLVFRLDSQDPINSKARISILATYLITSAALIFMLLILFIREINRMAVPSEYGYAYQISYWVALGSLFQGMYYIPVNFIFLRGKTKYIPVITIASAIVDLSLNLTLLPRYGVIAAAWAGCISKLIMAILALMISYPIYPIHYEIKRLAKVFILVMTIFLLNLIIPDYSLGLSLAIKGVLALLSLTILVLAGFFTNDEKLALVNNIKRIFRVKIITTSQ